MAEKQFSEKEEHAVNELVLYMENDSRAYKSIMAVVENLAKKMAKGIFDKELAVKGMMYPVMDAARAYKKEFSGEGYEKYDFNPSVRKAVAEELLDRYMEDIADKAEELKAKKETKNEAMVDKLGNVVSDEEWQEKEAKGLNEEKVKKEVKSKSLHEALENDAESALADYLGIDSSEVSQENYDHYGIPVFEADGEEWAVTDDYDLVEEAAKEEVISLIDELGVEALNWDNLGGIGEYLDMDWFDEAMAESNQFYIDDIREESASSDEYENRLEEEMAGAGVETEEDYLDVLNNNYANGYEWYVENFGQPDGDIIAKAGLDAEKAAEDVLATDGAGHLLSGYDGKEVDHDFDGATYYMFRIN